MNKTKIIVICTIALALGLIAGRLSQPKHDHSAHAHAKGESAAADYTCSMHPQIRQPNSGKCPICAMDLIPAERGDGNESGPREVTLSEHAKALAKIQTTAVERRYPDAKIRLLGRIVPDETLNRTLSARFPARIERLYINYTGVGIKAGDHLARIYSPELLTAQAELLGAIAFKDDRAESNARDKLLLWGLTEQHINAIIANGKPTDTMDIDAPIGGIVMEKMVNEGDYLETGMPLFMISDLAKVWVVFDAYEMDKVWLRFGQKVTFTVEALPGQSFEGKIAFVPPVLDSQTRTFKVRVNVDNKDQRLRPGMFVTGEVHARLSAGGVAMDSDLQGKWISPMHPEIVKDEPGTCDVCGMALVPASELGYIPDAEGEPPVVVPATAVLKTGKRAIAYVELPNREKPTYEGREIVLGPRAGNAYIVVEGLAEGERVVTNGAFKIDSTLQLQAKPSMMSAPAAEQKRIEGATPEQREGVVAMLALYYPIWSALSADNLEEAKAKAQQMGSEIAALHSLPGSGEAAAYFHKTLGRLEKTLAQLANSEGMGQARKTFETLSIALIDSVRVLGVPEGTKVHLAYCPMAFEGRRADWLQPNEDLLNPYFGAEMLTCGAFDELEPAMQQSAAPAHTGHQH